MAVAVSPRPGPPRTRSSNPSLKVALVGNPNVGKTTLFNSLTGLRQHTANWPGTTVELATGSARHVDLSLLLTDLPGVYGLTAHAEDEWVTRRFLLGEKPDVVVLVVDASCLERNLFLVTETTELFERVVVALNKVDVAAARGMTVDAERLAARLGVPIVPVMAQRGEGVPELLETIGRVASLDVAVPPARLTFSPELEAAIATVERRIAEDASTDAPARWTALRLLQGDREVLERVDLVPAEASIAQAAATCCAGPAATFEARPADASQAPRLLDGVVDPRADLELEVADRRYGWVHTISAECVRSESADLPPLTARLDDVLLHPLLGYLSMAVIFAAVFWASFQASAPLSEAVAGAIGWAGDAVQTVLVSAEAPDWLRSLLVDGVLAGIGAVLSFVPYMALFFAAISALESSGYMARASLLGDRFMQAVGLHGRSLFPLVSAFGCNVPALSATKAMESQRDRFVTCLVIPFVPCNARLGVMAIMAGAFFGGGLGGLVMLGLILISLVVVAAAALLYRGTLLPSDPAPLLLELPPCALPRWQDVLIPAAMRVWAFVSRIWRFLLPATVVVWALTYFPAGSAPEESLAGTLGGWLAVPGQLLGFDWRLMLAILFGFVAKETTLDTLGIVYGMSDSGPLTGALAASTSPLVGLAFLVVYMLYVPCLATVIQMRREMGSYRWVALGIAINVGTAFALGFAVEWAGVLLGAVR